MYLSKERRESAAWHGCHVTQQSLVLWFLGVIDEMKIVEESETVNLRTGERYQRITGNGESLVGKHQRGQRKNNDEANQGRERGLQQRLSGPGSSPGTSRKRLGDCAVGGSSSDADI